MQGYYPAYPQYDPNDYLRQQAAGIANGFRPPTPQAPQIIAFPVSSIDEMRSMRIDNPMCTYIGVDDTNKKNYIKKIGDNGLAVLYSYSLDNPPTPMTDAERIAALEQRLASFETGSVT